MFDDKIITYSLKKDTYNNGNNGKNFLSETSSPPKRRLLKKRSHSDSDTYSRFNKSISDTYEISSTYHFIDYSSLSDEGERKTQCCKKCVIL